MIIKEGHTTWTTIPGHSPMRDQKHYQLGKMKLLYIMSLVTECTVTEAVACSNKVKCLLHMKLHMTSHVNCYEEVPRYIHLRM